MTSSGETVLTLETDETNLTYTNNLQIMVIVFSSVAGLMLLLILILLIMYCIHQRRRQQTRQETKMRHSNIVL